MFSKKINTAKGIAHESKTQQQQNKQANINTGPLAPKSGVLLLCDRVKSACPLKSSVLTVQS